MFYVEKDIASAKTEAKRPTILEQLGRREYALMKELDGVRKAIHSLKENPEVNEVLQTVMNIQGLHY